MAQAAVATRRLGDVLGDATSLLSSISNESRLEAEVLLADALGCTRTQLMVRLREAIEASARDTFDAWLRRRLVREPLAYIRGRREFFGIDLACDRRALIPRPETELLVEIGIDACRGIERARVADVGTGGGAIAIAVAMHATDARLTAIDASGHALALARENVRAHGLEVRIALAHGDLLEDVGEFDIVLANLPYVSQDDWEALPPELRDHEPREALIGGPSGTEVIERLLRQAPAHLAPGGVLACEIGDGQADRVIRDASEAFPRADVTVHRDLAGLERVVVVRRGLL